MISAAGSGLVLKGKFEKVLTCISLKNDAIIRHTHDKSMGLVDFSAKHWSGSAICTWNEVQVVTPLIVQLVPVCQKKRAAACYLQG